MKKIYLTIVAFFLVFQFVYAQDQWTTVGNIIYNTNYLSVGIGTQSPQANLEICNSSYSNGNQLIVSGAEFNRYYGIIGETVATGQTTLSLGTKSNYINYFQTLNLFNGNVGIGTTNPQNKLDVKGTIHSQQVTVDMNGWSDYVFKKGYGLPALSNVKTYINKNHHLPEIPSEQQIEKDGLNLGEMNKILVKKVEELTLYLIEKDQQVREDEAKVNKQRAEIDQLKQQMILIMKKLNK